jgi:6-phosphogluconate dehydrogenase
VSSTVFSQTDTTNNTKCFPIPVVKQIMKDILSGDSAKAQLKLTETQLLDTEKKVVLKDSVINTLRLKETNYTTIIDSEKQKFQIMETYSKKLEWDLKKEKVKNKFKSILGTGVIAVLTFFLIQK